MTDEMRASPAYGALKNSTRHLLAFIVEEVARQGGGVATIHNDDVEDLSALHELAARGLVEVATLSDRSLVCMSSRWREFR